MDEVNEGKKPKKRVLNKEEEKRKEKPSKLGIREKTGGSYQLTFKLLGVETNSHSKPT